MSKKDKFKKERKEKTIHVMKIGTHKKSVIALWIILIGSMSFAVYKNFTAIDQHTTNEVKVIEQRVIDTNSIENFVKNFAKSYYSWENNKASIEQRTININQYLSKELQTLNVDTVRIDIPTSSTVNNVEIWSVSQSSENEFDVAYEVDQTIKENEQSKLVTSSYKVKVYVDDDKNLVIIQNPTITSTLEKSNYEPKVKEDDASIDATITQDATEFLETFFKLYPTATEKELAYYVKGDVLKPITGEYLFAELINPTFNKDGDSLKVNVMVKFLDQKTKAIQLSQYELVLHKNDNWLIIKEE